MKLWYKRNGLLWLSAGLNVGLLCVCLVLGWLLFSPKNHLIFPMVPPPGMPPMAPDVDLISNKLNLNEDQREKLTEMVAVIRENTESDFEELRQMRLRTIRQIVESPGDLELVERLLQENEHVPRGIAGRMLGHMSNFATILTPEQRELLLKEIEEMDQRPIRMIREE
ncbi:MAG: Spy/CpxP family protein refolding chaperone [Candidatus Sumerlaeia bacterium]|nr:Spy/CpxP family protein refolding chaperone [Candidatus Sumerlaeia bacterium]